jgi:hypothetical protein
MKTMSKPSCISTVTIFHLSRKPSFISTVHWHYLSREHLSSQPFDHLSSQPWLTAELPLQVVLQEVLNLSGSFLQAVSFTKCISQSRTSCAARRRGLDSDVALVVKDTSKPEGLKA